MRHGCPRGIPQEPSKLAVILAFKDRPSSVGSLALAYEAPLRHSMALSSSCWLARSANLVLGVVRARAPSLRAERLTGGARPLCPATSNVPGTFGFIGTFISEARDPQGITQDMARKLTSPDSQFRYLNFSVLGCVNHTMSEFLMHGSPRGFLGTQEFCRWGQFHF